MLLPSIQNLNAPGDGARKHSAKADYLIQIFAKSPGPHKDGGIQYLCARIFWSRFSKFLKHNSRLVALLNKIGVIGIITILLNFAWHRQRLRIS
ncbi:hypothetical protein AB433_05065 [Croceicoccus naphthovorans]|uniref:Uncharacterized protein n=2 Tax=Croceicoccus naphthovorans TaxID=1348774 RepID=A0A0G3XGH2_9SPHN|nr:hypothetical protein AB433_05065 [Croceicoccus naphthovorans]